MPQSVLKKAGKLFRRRKYTAVIRLLEGQVFRFRDSQEFYSLLGRSCLRAGDHGGASSYLKRADQLRADDPLTLLGLAAAAIRRADVDEALEHWLRVLDLDPGNRIARRGLRLLRDIGGGSLPAADAVERLGFHRLLPAAPLRPARLLLSLVVSCLLAAGVLAGVLWLPSALRDRSTAGRKDLLVLPDLPRAPGLWTLAPEESATRYVLKDEDVRTAFERAKKCLRENRDNGAVREINRLLLSNASPAVKEKAALLRGFLVTPDFSNVREPFAYGEVAKDPPLHHGGFAVWQGKVANLRIEAERLRFDLLVGYQQEKVLQGIVPVELGFAVQLEDGSSVEVLGRILSRSGPVRLEGISLHRIPGL